MVLGKQVNTSYGTTIDILGLTSDGDVVIVELKKAKAPREVLTQIFEYLVWAEKLRYDELNEIAHSKRKLGEGESLMKAFLEYFKGRADANPEFNAGRRLVILTHDFDPKILDRLSIMEDGV